VNNAVARTAGLLGIAVFGIVILHASGHELDRHLSQWTVTPEVRRSLDEQRVRLAGAELSSDIDDETRAALRQAINESFVFGFRTVMWVAVGLALASSLSAFIMIEDKAVPSAAGELNLNGSRAR
jgi:hypothetical protein